MIFPFRNPVFCEVTEKLEKDTRPSYIKKALAKSELSDIPDDFELPKGSVKRGMKLFKKHCLQCHSIYPDNRLIYAGQINLGPTMFMVCGRASGEYEMFNRGVNPQNSEGILWTDAALMNYMKNPRKMVGGPVQMDMFEGISDFQTRVDIIHYLYTLNWDNEKLTKPAPRPEGNVFKRYWNIFTGAEKEQSWHENSHSDHKAYVEEEKP